MSQDTLRDHLSRRLARTYARTQMAAPPERSAHSQFEMTVSGVTDLNAHLRRLTFSAAEFADLSLVSSDEYFGLIMPPAGGPLVMPDGDRTNIRAAIADLADPPTLRWYTIRAHRPVEQQIDVDVVTHAHPGPGLAWVMRAKVGDRAGFRTGGGLYRGGSVGQPQVLIGDETAVPAILAILDGPEVRSAGPLRVHLEVPDVTYLDGVEIPAEVTIHLRGDELPGTALLDALATSADLDDLGYAWVCGESSLATGLRRHLVRERGLDKRQVLFSGYWKLGQARG